MAYNVVPIIIVVNCLILGQSLGSPVKLLVESSISKERSDESNLVKRAITQNEELPGEFTIKVSGSKETGKILLRDVITNVEDQLLNAVPPVSLVDSAAVVDDQTPFLEPSTNGQDNNFEKTKGDEAEYEWEYYFDCDEENSTEVATDHPHEQRRRRRAVTSSTTQKPTESSEESSTEEQHRDLFIAVKPIKPNAHLSLLTGISFHKPEELTDDQKDILTHKEIQTETPLHAGNETQSDEDSTEASGSNSNEEKDDDYDEDCEEETTDLPEEQSDEVAKVNSTEIENSAKEDLNLSSSDYYPKSKKKKLGYGAKCKAKKKKKTTLWDVSRRKRNSESDEDSSNQESAESLMFAKLRAARSAEKEAAVQSSDSIPPECVGIEEPEPSDDLKPASAFPQCAAHHFKKQKEQRKNQGK